MNRAVNVKIKPDEELYETVVLPNQKLRKLAPLILTLLTGYRDDPYVRRYADGELAGLDDAVQSELLRQVKEAQDELNALNYINENLQTASKAGVGYFAERFYEAREAQDNGAQIADNTQPMGLTLTDRVLRLEEMFSSLMERLDNTSGTPVPQSDPYIFSPPVESENSSSSLNLPPEVLPEDDNVIEAEVIEETPATEDVYVDSWDDLVVTEQNEGIDEDSAPDTSLANALLDSIGGL